MICNGDAGARTHLVHTQVRFNIDVSAIDDPDNCDGYACNRYGDRDQRISTRESDNSDRHVKMNFDAE
jgi:hypothetical protein